MTRIISNGSKWNGQAPDSIETLIDVLSREPLADDMRVCAYQLRCDHDRRVAVDMGCDPENTWQFAGNFLHRSHVFNVITDDADLIATLRVAIVANQQKQANEQVQR